MMLMERLAMMTLTLMPSSAANVIMHFLIVSLSFSLDLKCLLLELAWSADIACSSSATFSALC